MSEFIYTLDEALDLINQGRTKDITYSSGGISSYSFGRPSGTGGVLNRTSTFGNYSGVSETRANPFWVTKGMLKRHIANHSIRAKEIDGQWYLSEEGIRKIKQYYKRKETEHNKNIRKAVLIVIIIVAIGIPFVYFAAKRMAEYTQNRNKTEQQILWEQQHGEVYRR